MLDLRLVFLRRQAVSLVDAPGALKVREPRQLTLIRNNCSARKICSAYRSCAPCPLGVSVPAARTLATWGQPVSHIPRSHTTHPTYSRYLATMPRAGRANAANPASNNKNMARPQPSTSLPVPDTSVRRSSRRKSAKPTTYEEKASDAEDGEENPTDADMHTEDAQQAIRDLVEMDKFFRENNKRQRLAAEQSNLSRQRDDGHGMGNPESSTVDVRERDTPSRQRKKPALLPTPEKDLDPDTIKTEQDADYVPATPHGTTTESKEEPEAAEESVERAAARPPAVNSSYLPLPWKGRLGYVSPCSPFFAVSKMCYSC